MQRRLEGGRRSEDGSAEDSVAGRRMSRKNCYFRAGTQKGPPAILLSSILTYTTMLRAVYQKICHPL